MIETNETVMDSIEFEHYIRRVSEVFRRIMPKVKNPYSEKGLPKITGSGIADKTDFSYDMPMERFLFRMSDDMDYVFISKADESINIESNMFNLRFIPSSNQYDSEKTWINKHYAKEFMSGEDRKNVVACFKGEEIYFLSEKQISRNYRVEDELYEHLVNFLLIISHAIVREYILGVSQFNKIASEKNLIIKNKWIPIVENKEPTLNGYKSNIIEIKDYRIIYDNDDIIPGHREIHCDCWGVRGHYRHYKNGNTVFIKAYQKGKKRNKIEAEPKTYILGKVKE